MTQWHPIFGHLLRQALQDYYDVQTNVPVGDLPREADILVLRRASAVKPPFQSLWQYLTRWSILEFKGRSESAHVDHIALLIEVGLGIYRRLQETGPHTGKAPRSEASFWYLANHLSPRFLRKAVELTGEVQAVGPGLWRCGILGSQLFLVSNRDVPTNPETLSVHLVSEESTAKAREMVDVVLSNESLWSGFGPWLGYVHPELWKEVQIMAKKRNLDKLRAEFIREMIKEHSAEELFDQGAAKEFKEKLGLEGLMALLSSEERRELVRLIESTKN